MSGFGRFGPRGRNLRLRRLVRRSHLGFSLFASLFARVGHFRGQLGGRSGTELLDLGAQPLDLAAG